MRNLIYIILILLTATTATAQSPTRGGGNNQLQSWYGGFKVIRYLAPPNTFNPWATYDSLGMVWIDSTTTKKLMWHTGVYRRYVASETYVDSLFATAVTGVTQQTLDDSCAAIRADISGGSTDSFVYSTKAYRQKGIDSVNITVATRVKYTDTASMLLPYQRTVNATSGTVTSVATGYGASGGTITTTGTISADTAAMATRSRVQKAVDSLNISIGTKGSGTVTNVATNNGTGITGGAITGTGTIAADTTILGTRLWRDKLADSINITVATRVKYTDTASMLLPYQRTVNATSGTVTSVATNTGTGITGGTITTSGTIAADTTVLDTRAWRDKLKDTLNAQDALRVKYTDTASMLSPYLSEQHASVTYVAIVADTTISAAYTLTSRDYHRTIHCTNGSNIALTIPTGLGTTFECVVLAEGAGTVTPTTSSTTFYYQPTSTTKIKSQGGATIRSWATANSYLIIGSLE